jgi:hypothetical protein
MITLSLVALPARFAVCRLPPEAPIPRWEAAVSFLSITRTSEELSMVCPEESIPIGVMAEGGWRCVRGAGPLDFSLVGILAAMVKPAGRRGHPRIRDLDLPHRLSAGEGANIRSDREHPAWARTSSGGLTDPFAKGGRRRCRTGS